MKFCGLLLFLYAVSSTLFASDNTTIRVGVQATGTLAWELAVLQSESQPKNSAFLIEQIPLVNAEAGKIALQSGAVDMIVSDWLWVSRMRSEGGDLTFYPYSTVSGALMVPDKSAIKSLKDLSAKKLGIAGGELDKNWLLLRALGNQENLDLNASVEKVFGAPPLINEQLKLGRVDAALNYWHFGVQLEVQGYRQLLDGKAILQGLGIQENVPFLGYVFKQSWAANHKAALNSFFDSAIHAKQSLCASEAEWQRIVPLTQEKDVATQTKLRQRYCKGEVQQWGRAEQQAAERIYSLIRKVSNNPLTGKSEHLQPGTFWQ